MAPTGEFPAFGLTTDPPAFTALRSTRAPSAFPLDDRAQGSAHVADPLIGRTIADRYRIVEQIGRGGMGVVYRVEHARIGKLMALKLLTGELTRDGVQVGRFKREALMASKLSHPNTVQVFDFGMADGLVYLAMEYLRGEDLGRIIRREGALSVERTEKIIVQIANSLSEAHEMGIVHRDLKPENILIVRGNAGEELVKVLDFGLAKLRESSELSEVTSRGAIVGTPYYMSPEQIRGESADPLSDVYSLGALTYACLTGAPVFDAGTPLGVFTKHLLEAPIPPHVRRPELNIPESVSRLVMRTLEKEPSQRPASVAVLRDTLAEELRNIGAQAVDRLLSFGELQKLNDEESSAATRAEIEQYERTLRRRGHLALLVIGLVVLAGFGAGALGLRRLLAPTAFAGRELEPNDAASQANVLPFGTAVSARLGQRLDASRSDRDFFQVSVPKTAKAVALTLSALPNMALCVWIYPKGAESPFGRYCSGREGRNLELSQLALPAGDYVLGVMQDRDAYTRAPAPPVNENVSDDYRLELSSVSVSAARETEPNDTPQTASRLSADLTISAKLAFMRDVDVFCAEKTGRVRFEVEDIGTRPRDSVLEVKTLSGPDAHVPVRVHRAAAGFGHSPRDTASPWQSAEISGDAVAPCLEVTLVPNPWGPTPTPDVAPASDAEYRVHVQTR
jgi:serine/threonine protein kinase